MSVEDILKALVAANAGLLAMFIHHMFRCRDIRVELERLKRKVDER